MSDLDRARARAEAFAHAVDHGPRHSSRLSDEPELTEGVELAGRLRTAGAVTPRPEFTAELRYRLLEQARARAATTPTVLRSTPDGPDDPPLREDVDASVTALRPRHGRRIRLVASTAALVLLGAGIGSAAAAQQAVPGDTLYGVKRGIENVSTKVSVGDDSRGRRDLEHAMTRLSEVRELAEAAGDATTVNSTLNDFSAQARKGVSRLVTAYQQDGDVSSITTITAFITGAREALGELAPKLPPESLKAAVEALATIEQLARYTSVACPKCDPARPAKGGDQPSVSGPSDPVNGGPTTQPSTAPTTRESGKPGSTTSQLPNTIEESQTPPSSLKTPTSSTTPTIVPSLPSTSTSAWPWPLPTLSYPSTPIIVPGVISPLLPPWN
jgi:hypothetical protein